LIQLFCEDLEGVFSKDLYLDPAQFLDLSPDEQLIQVYIRAKQADIIPPDLDLEHLQGMFSIYQRNVEALRHYRPQVYSDQLTLFTATPFNGSKRVDRTYEWQALTPQKLAVNMIPGNHYSILKKPNLYHLADLLKERLAKIE
jgi:thioesterase domain-containing protein